MADGVKISEFPATETLQDGCCFPIVSNGENKKITKAKLFNLMFNVIYPVGSIYLTVNAANPATLFGGTWQKIEDRFLIGASSSRAVNSTGGASTSKVTSKRLTSIWTGDDQRYPNYVDGADEQNISIIPPYLAVYIWKRTS